MLPLQDGFVNVARLIRTTAEAETIHALAHLAALDAIGSAADNLRAAVAGDDHECREMYPPMLEQDAIENHKAKRMFGYAVKAEKVHSRLYRMALEAVTQDKDLAGTNFYLYPVCGHIELGKPPELCPVCNAKGSKHIQV